MKYEMRSIQTFSSSQSETNSVISLRHFDHDVAGAWVKLHRLRLARALVQHLRALMRQDGVRHPMNQQQRLRRELAHRMRSRKLAGNRDDGGDIRTQRAGIDRHRAPK